MKKLLLGLLVLGLGFSGTGFAAKFEKTSKMTNAAASELQTVVKNSTRSDRVFGDATAALSFSFTRKDTEEDINTVKQLNYKTESLNGDDIAAEEFQDKTAKELGEHLLSLAMESGDDEKLVNESLDAIVAALEEVKKDSSLLIYGTNHYDEDGSWQIINILDTTNDEVLFLRVGYVGT